MLDFRSNSRNIHFFQHTTHKKSTKNAKTGEKKEDETNNNIDSLAPSTPFWIIAQMKKLQI